MTDPQDKDLALALRRLATTRKLSPAAALLRRAAQRLEVLSDLHDEARPYLAQKSLERLQAQVQEVCEQCEEGIRLFKKEMED